MGTVPATIPLHSAPLGCPAFALFHQAPLLTPVGENLVMTLGSHVGPPGALGSQWISLSQTATGRHAVAPPPEGHGAVGPPSHAVEETVRFVLVAPLTKRVKNSGTL